jgi:hypothetical protein
MRAHDGTAPITRQSGKSRQVIMRYGCNKRCETRCITGRISPQNNPRSRDHYARLRHSGRCHGRALRGVADRLRTVLVAMLKSGPNTTLPAAADQLLLAPPPKTDDGTPTERPTVNRL